MPGDDGILGKAPLVVDDREIGVAHAAMLDRDLDVLGAERTWIIHCGTSGFPASRAAQPRIFVNAMLCGNRFLHS